MFSGLLYLLQLLKALERFALSRNGQHRPRGSQSPFSARSVAHLANILAGGFVEIDEDRGARLRRDAEEPQRVPRTRANHEACTVHLVWQKNRLVKSSVPTLRHVTVIVASCCFP